MAEPSLKPCPFCGSLNIDPEGWASTESKGPACDECGASAGGPLKPPEENIALWNSRQTQQGCFPPDGTEDGSIHVLGDNFHGHAVFERARWNADTQSWTRWLDTLPAGDYAKLCKSKYCGLWTDTSFPLIVAPATETC